MSLLRCSGGVGRHEVLAGRPVVSVQRNAIVAHFALYDAAGVLVSGSSYMRGDGNGDDFHLNLFAPQTVDINPATGSRLPPGRYLWLGYFHIHYGHFLLSTLQRLWALPVEERSSLLLLTPNANARDALKTSFIGDCLAALGIAAEQIVSVDTGTVIPEIVVPQPMFVETSHVYADWSAFMRTVADAVAGPDTGERSDVPVYLSRERLTSGTRGTTNEVEISNGLRLHGVEVVFPETLSLADQIRLWRRHEMFAGFASSAFHTAAFAHAKSIVTIHRNQFAQVNQTLVDDACGHRALYLNAQPHIEHLGSDLNGYNELERIHQPEQIVTAIVEAFAALRGGCGGMQLRRGDQTIARRVAAIEPFGANVARGKPCLVSSVDPVHSISRGGPADEGAGLVSGRVSGYFQIHTQTEQDPWWQVDLGGAHHIYEVRIYNRNDDAFFRAFGIIVLTSDDGSDWTERNRHAGAEAPFGGGAMPMAHRWHPERPVQARYVRVVAPLNEPLHLEQVEVFGAAAVTAGPLQFPQGAS